MSDYDSIDDAAHAALMRISKLPEASKQEYIGLIYQDPKTGKYLFTDPIGSKSKDKARGTFAVPPGSLRALVHNHPGKDADANGRFSTDDVRMSKQLGVPSYIGVGDSVLKWHPKDGKMRRNQGVGTPVLSQIAMDLLPQKRTSNMVAQR
ncbi:MAG: hypothetical protein WD795_16365 [Woeseia sp.]